MWFGVKRKLSPKVEIVFPEDGWILQKLGSYLVEGIDFAHSSKWKSNDKKTWDLTYYMNYALHGPTKARIIGGYFTHAENKDFFSIGEKMHFGVCMCHKTHEQLSKVNSNSRIIYQPVDLERFTPKLILGFVGRFYESGRKGQELLERISQIPYVTLRCTEGKIPEEKMNEFYGNLDYVLVTSTVEGGPMCLTEGLACGKEVITTDVGIVDQFRGSPYVHVYDYRRQEQLLSLLKKMYDKKMEIRAHVQKYTIASFVAEHRRYFLQLQKNIT